MISAITLFSVFLVWGSAAWVYWDATDKKIGKIPGEKGFSNMSAGGWGTVTALLWVVGFPIYLSKRNSLTERAKTQPIEVKRRWLKLSIFCLLGAFGVYGSFADPTTDERVAKRAIPDEKPKNAPAVQAPQVKPAQTPTASTTTGAQPAPVAATTSSASMEKNANATQPASVPPTQVTEVPQSKPVAAPPATAASAAELEAKARAREEQVAQRRATMERDQEEKRRLKATQSACVYKPVMTDEDLARCR
jgi:hypothetical protein